MNTEATPDHNDALPADLAAEAEALLAEPADDLIGPAQPTDQAQPEPQTGEIVSSFLEITFNGLIAPKRGEHWQLKRDECDAVGGAYGAVIDKYWPDLNIGVEFTAVLVTLTVFGPRVAEDAKIAAEKNADDSTPDQDRDDE